MITGVLGAILIVMFIYGLYSVISGRFGLRKKRAVKGRHARIAGLIFLSAPVLWILIVVAADVARVKSEAGELAVLIAVPLAAVIGGFVSALRYLHNHRQDAS